MARPCTVCNHPRRGEIDAAIAAKRTSRTIGSEYNVSKAAVLRHKPHIADMIAEIEARAIDATDDAVATLRDARRGPLDAAAQLARLVNETWEIFEAAKQAQERRLALQALAEQRANVRLVAELAGEVPTQGTAQVLLSTEYAVLAGVLERELVAYPDARLAISTALSALTPS